jgi:glycosyltransferase involved in cell wall biosynthesis
MVSFQARLSTGLIERGIEVIYDLSDHSVQAILVIGGTRNLAGLWRARQAGIPVIQRLNGMNWIHRRRYTGIRHYLRAEMGNWLLSKIRSHLASRVIYQSNFARDWWERVYGKTRIPHQVIYNGVDLNSYSPDGQQERPLDRTRLLLVEGTLGGGYEMGLETAIELAQRVRQLHLRQVELMVVGRVSPSLQAKWLAKAPFPLVFTGQIPGTQVPLLDRSAHLLYAADLQAACPNSTIEALACGLPVIAFQTGALPELVAGDAGRIVPYGGDAWKLEAPDVPALAQAAMEIIDQPERFRAAARARAESMFDLTHMIDRYIQVFSG